MSHLLLIVELIITLYAHFHPTLPTCNLAKSDVCVCIENPNSAAVLLCCSSAVTLLYGVASTCDS